MDLEMMKKQVSLLGYITEAWGPVVKTGNNYRLDPCPVCGRLDHFTIYPESNSYSSFSGCCKGGSIIDFFMEVEDLDQAQAIEKLQALAGVAATKEKQKESKPKAQANAQAKPHANPEEARQLIELAQGGALDYYKGRGLTDRIIKAYKLGTLAGGYNKPGYGKAFKYVIPVSNSFIILRSDNEKDRYRNIGSPEILNIEYLQDLSLTEIFITEGIFDALSLEELDRKAIALNSTAQARQLIEALEADRDQVKNKRFILALDNDQGGRKTAEQLKGALLEMDLPFNELNLAGHKDINEYFIKDKAGLLQAIEALPLSGTVYEYLLNEFELDQAERLSEPEILTGFKNLDKALGGGMYPGLYVMGAISSLGKTALALQLADRIAEQLQPVIFFSLEMGRYEMTCRSLARVLFEQTGDQGITTGHVLKTSYKGQDLYSSPSFQAALGAYKEGPAKHLTLLEGDFAIDVNKLRDIVKEFINRTGKRPVVFVDYLQVLKPINDRMTDKQNIDFTIVELKRMSRDLNLPVIVVSSFNRASYKVEVAFEAFKESGAIEFTADVVIALQLRGVVVAKDGSSNINELKSQDPRPLDMVILKNRRGRAYDSIPINYWPRQNHFAQE
jgi:KaiC/GvpD/RAD55 family RecA-like ATPase/5S rRNA maturation endonuclease (ribonuclease M5)